MQFGCMSAEARDGQDFSSFQDEEAQIEAVFREAIRLKTKVKRLLEERHEHIRIRNELHVTLKANSDHFLEEMRRRDLELSALKDEHAVQLQAEQSKLEFAQAEISRHGPQVVSMKAEILALEETLRSNHIGFVKKEQEMREFLRPQLDEALHELSMERHKRLEEANKAANKQSTQHKELLEELSKARSEISLLESSKVDRSTLARYRSEVEAKVRAVINENKNLKAKQKEMLSQKHKEAESRPKLPSTAVQVTRHNTMTLPKSRLSSSPGSRDSTTNLSFQVAAAPTFLSLDPPLVTARFRAQTGPRLPTASGKSNYLPPTRVTRAFADGKALVSDSYVDMSHLDQEESPKKRSSRSARSREANERATPAALPLLGGNM